MKMVKLASGIDTPVSNDEYKIITKIDTGNEPYGPEGRLYDDTLDERESTIAATLYSRGVLDRRAKNNRLYYIKF